MHPQINLKYVETNVKWLWFNTLKGFDEDESRLFVGTDQSFVEYKRTISEFNFWLSWTSQRFK